MGLKFRAESERNEMSSRMEQQNTPSLSRAYSYNDNHSRWGHWRKPWDEDNDEKRLAKTLKFTRVASSLFAVPSGSRELVRNSL